MLNEFSTRSSDRFVEIAFKSTTEIGDYLVTFYNANGNAISSSALSDFSIGSAKNGLTFLSLTHSHSDSVLGIALTGAGSTWDFVSNGASIKAKDGAANGESSINLGSGDIFQQRGNGCGSNTFSWAVASNPTRGNVNLNQFPTCSVTIFINEIVYGKTSGNYLEFGFTQGLPTSELAAYTIELYSRSLRAPVGTSFALDTATIGSSTDGITFAYISLDTTRRSLRVLQSLSPDGFALCDEEGKAHLEFFSMRGSPISATSGCAEGSASNDFPVSTSGDIVFGGNQGTGCGTGDFAFGANGNTMGGKNNGQSIDCSSKDVPNSSVLSSRAPTPAPTPFATPFPSSQPSVNTNECQLGTHNCNRNADCIDTPTRFTCACRTGTCFNDL